MAAQCSRFDGIERAKLRQLNIPMLMLSSGLNSAASLQSGNLDIRVI